MIDRKTRDGYRRAKYVVLSLFVFFAGGSLTACGGGGGGGGGTASPPPPPPPTNSPPTLTGNLSQSFSENADVSFVLGVDDADGDAVTVTIGTSNDGQFFTLNTGTGEIRSTQQFDFENPQDVDGDNVYVQTVTLNDGTVSVDREVRVAITNVDEPPICNVIPAVDIDENVTGPLATLSASDPDAGDDNIAVFENLSVSDSRLDGLLSIDGASGEISVDTALDAEAYEDDFSFTVSADYRTNGLFDRCSVAVTLNDLPARVTSGILFDDNLKRVQALSDLNGDGSADFWMADESPSADGPVTGSLVFGQTFADALAADGAATLSVSSLDTSQRLRIAATFSLGFGNATSVTVSSISDMDGDGSPDLLVASNQPPNDGLDPTRRPWGFVVFAATIASNTSGTLDLNALSATEGFSLTGPVDFNGGAASYVVANLDGLAGDEIALSLPEAIGTGAESGRLHVIDGVSLAGASGNLDFDLEASTRTFEGPFDVDATLIVGELNRIGDLDADGVDELTMQSGQAVAIFPSTNLIAAAGGSIDSLNPLLLGLENDLAGDLGQANVDDDAISDLLLVRGDGSPGSRQAAVVFGDALAPIVASDSEIALTTSNFNVGDYTDLSSNGRGDGPEPVRLMGIGDLDGDGQEEVALSLLESPGAEPGSVYLIRGSALTGLPGFDFSVDNFTAAEGTRIVSVPFLFTSLSTQVSLAPDIDGDGVPDLYLTSNRRLADDPDGIAIIVKSSDLAAALNADQAEVDVQRLFFDETPAAP